MTRRSCAYRWPRSPRAWQGTWEADDKSHNGELRSTVKQVDGEKWEARFSGYCNRQFVYDVKMQGKRDGEKVVFEGKADLGEKDGGVYTWTGEMIGDKFTGKYKSEKGKKGTFVMKPAGKGE